MDAEQHGPLVTLDDHNDHNREPHSC